jgi:hypothetical protein
MAAAAAVTAVVVVMSDGVLARLCVKLRDTSGWWRMKSYVIGQARPICGGTQVIGSADIADGSLQIPHCSVHFISLLASDCLRGVSRLLHALVVLFWSQRKVLFRKTDRTRAEEVPYSVSD